MHPFEKVDNSARCKILYVSKKQIKDILFFKTKNFGLSFLLFYPFTKP